MKFNISEDYTLFIGFEGLDATYKNTNSRILKEYIKNRLNEYSSNYNIEIVSFPRYNEKSSDFIKKYLNKEFSGITESYTNLLDLYYYSGFDTQIYNLCITELKWISGLFFQDMKEYSDNIIIDKPTVIIFDRYLYSQLYYLSPNIFKYQNILQNTFIKEYKNHNYYSNFNEYLSRYIYLFAEFFYNLENLDIVFKMKNSIMNINKTINKRNKKDIYEEDIQYIYQVKNNYSSLDLLKEFREDEDIFLKFYISDNARARLEGPMLGRPWICGDAARPAEKFIRSIDINVNSRDRLDIAAEICREIDPTIDAFGEIIKRFGR